VQRAQAANPRFDTSPASLAAVAAICTRLDGLPLAIELAAARCKIFGAPALLARLEQRLGLLSGGAHDLPARHQSLRDTIEWSYELLGAHEQALFRRLGVFAGCTIDAATEILSFEFGGLNDQTNELKTQNSELNTLAGLSALVDQSLLQQNEGPDGEPRFWLLETIREYALERLARSGEEPAMRERHARYFLALAEQAEPELTGARQGEWLDRLEREHDNLRATLAWALGAGQSELAARTASAIWRFWATRGYLSEGRQWPSQILLHDAAISPASRAKLLHAAGGLALWQNDYGAARSYFDQSLTIRRSLGDKAGIAMGLVGLAVADKEQGYYQKAQHYLEESLPLLRAIGDTWGTAAALNNLGVLANSQNQHQRAQAFHEESLLLRRQLGNTEGMAISLSNLGMVAYSQGDNQRARSLFLESQTLLLKLNDQRGLANIFANLGNVERNQGHYAKAIAHYLESIATSKAIGERRNITECLAELADTLLRQDHATYAAHLYGLAEILREQIGTTVEPAEQPAYDQSIASLRAQLGEQAFAAAWAAGRALTLEQAIAEALRASE
jgi:tetratricopeptide (TPR) repeat protein